MFQNHDKNIITPTQLYEINLVYQAKNQFSIQLPILFSDIFPKITLIVQNQFKKRQKKFYYHYHSCSFLNLVISNNRLNSFIPQISFQYRKCLQIVECWQLYYFIILNKTMKKRALPDEEEDYSGSKRNQDDWHDNSNRAHKRQGEQYKCGKPSCGKFYHSYTAFYNHCKKNHNGQFPAGSLMNDKLFEGPSKNRGRPRIKKNDTKDQTQIESMKTENQLIEFLGTLKTKKNEELIVYVENPKERLEKSIKIVSLWDEKFNTYLAELELFNNIVVDHDLPEFYDPIQIDQYKDKLDSYSFNSIYLFMTDKQKIEIHEVKQQGEPLLRKILVVWLARILSQSLLAEVVYTVAQMNQGIQKITEKQILVGRGMKLKQLIQKYFLCFLNEKKNGITHNSHAEDQSQS